MLNFTFFSLPSFFETNFGGMKTSKEREREMKREEKGKIAIRASNQNKKRENIPPDDHSFPSFLIVS